MPAAPSPFSDHSAVHICLPPHRSQAATLGNWFSSLLQRQDQLARWLAMGRPRAYWLTGFFNPQACDDVTACQQLIVICGCMQS